MPDDGSAASPSPLLVPAVVAFVAAVLVAASATGSGLLGPGAILTSDETQLRRVIGIAVALTSLAAIVRVRPSFSALATGAGILAAVAALTMPVSDVALDLGELLDREPPPPAESTPGGPPTIVPLPPGASVELRGGVFVILLPDGSEQVLPGGPGGPGAVEFQTSDGGRFTTSGTPAEGQVVLVPVDEGGGASGQLQAPSTEHLSLWLGYGLLGLLIAGVLWLALFPPRSMWRGRAEAGDDEGNSTDATPVLDLAAAEAGLHLSLAAMLQDRDPRTAIVGAYAVLLDALANAGAPRRPEEAPHEHLDRVLAPLGVRPDPMHLLAGLFVLARFSPHEPTTDHRREAIAALRGAVRS